MWKLKIQSNSVERKANRFATMLASRHFYSDCSIHNAPVDFQQIHRIFCSTSAKYFARATEAGMVFYPNSNYLLHFFYYATKAIERWLFVVFTFLCVCVSLLCSSLCYCLFFSIIAIFFCSSVVVVVLQVIVIGSFKVLLFLTLVCFYFIRFIFIYFLFARVCRRTLCVWDMQNTMWAGCRFAAFHSSKSCVDFYC